jgi:hypothetical protein
MKQRSHVFKINCDLAEDDSDSCKEELCTPLKESGSKVWMISEFSEPSDSDSSLSFEL